MPTNQPDPTDGFDDASQFFDGPLKLPVRGKVYTIPEVDVELGLIITGVLAGRKTELTGKPTHELYKRLLGPVWDELAADGVPVQIINRVGETAMVDFTQGRDMARLVWKYGVSPEALAASKQAAAPTSKTTAPASRSTRTGAATGTRSRASTSGTRGRKQAK